MSDPTAESICAADCTSGCHSDSCEHHGYFALASRQPEPAREAALREALTEWARLFLDGLSFNVSALQVAGWAEGRAPDVAAGILAWPSVRAALAARPEPSREAALREALRTMAVYAFRGREPCVRLRDVLAILARPAPPSEGLDVERLGDAIVAAVRAERAPIGYKGDGWPAYWEKDRPATVLNVGSLAKRLAREYAALTPADPSAAKEADHD